MKSKLLLMLCCIISLNIQAEFDCYIDPPEKLEKVSE